MAPDLELKSKEALVDENYYLVYDLFYKAIGLNPNNADLYADRAQVNIKVNNLTNAVVDANKAIELNPSHSKAYLRKGKVCIMLEECETAKASLEMGASLAPGDSRFTD
ncbi:unnamed protein product [Sphenostylis stenocarpa]|uniref:Uncharacterized protein n=1 Tax=Sphenostylis stenocarpa TaxID=92480 RepID=A0AA86W2B3_9FABA|nr:unnamed protein product [Sphenostylis stenocarpa]